MTVINEKDEDLYLSEEIASNDGINISELEKKLSESDDILECVMNEIRY